MPITPALIFFLCLFTPIGAHAQSNSNFRIESPSFQHNTTIPVQYTCQGEDISPALIISNIPVGTKSLALIVDDPDAPKGDWVHWVVYNIPPRAMIDQDSIPGMQGMNDFRRKDWGGPCPPSGTHRYFFKLYALDDTLTLRQPVKKSILEHAMSGHIIAQAQLIGLYQKN